MPKYLHHTYELRCGGNPPNPTPSDMSRMPVLQLQICIVLSPSYGTAVSENGSWRVYFRLSAIASNINM